MEIIIAICLGIIIGIFTGIVPGIHVNTICALLLTFSFSLANTNIDAEIVIVFIASLAIAHTFFDIIPGLFLGIPGDSTFALLPGHSLVKKGYGILAIRLSAIGSLFGLCIGLLITGIFLLTDFSKVLAKYLPHYIFFILIIISLILIISEKNRFYSLIVFFVSGLLGMLVFTTPIVPPQGAPINSLFPALTGLFGISGLLWALLTLEGKNNVTINKEQNINLLETPLPSIRGGLAGMIVGILPGLGGANAATMLLLIERWLGSNKDRNYENRSYLVTTSSLNTSEAIIAIVSLYLIQKSRSGASVAIEQLIGSMMTLGNLQLILISMIISGIISTFLLWNGGPQIAKKIQKYNYASLNWSLMAFLFIMVLLFMNIGGIAVIICSTLVGLMPYVFNVRKGQLMGFFLIPVMIYYSGYGRKIYDMMNLTQRHAPIVIPEISTSLLLILVSLSMGISTYYLLSRKNIIIGNHKKYASNSITILFITGIFALLLSIVI